MKLSLKLCEAQEGSAIARQNIDIEPNSNLAATLVAMLVRALIDSAALPPDSLSLDISLDISLVRGLEVSNTILAPFHEMKDNLAEMRNPTDKPTTMKIEQV